MGVVAGLAPLVVMNAAALLRLGFPLNTSQANAFIVLIPISLAYAVVKHQVMGLRVVIRQGLQDFRLWFGASVSCLLTAPP